MTMSGGASGTSIPAANNNAMIGATRLSYSSVGPTSSCAAAAADHPFSTPSTTSTHHSGSAGNDLGNACSYSQSDFLAVLSPSTADFLRRERRSISGSLGGNDGDVVHPSTVAPPPATAVTSPSSAASLAAENAERTAANAARGIDNTSNGEHENNHHHPTDVDTIMNDDEDGAAGKLNDNTTHDGSGGRGTNQNDHPSNEDENNTKHPNNNSNYIDIHNNDDDNTSQLRQFVQSLLGMQLPVSSSPHSLSSCGGVSSSSTTMITPDPTSAAFFAISLLTKTAYSLSSSSSSSTDANDTFDGRAGGEGEGRRMAGGGGDGGGGSLKTNYWRPDDAYLAARALSLGGEDKRAIYILDKVGLIGFGMEGGGSGIGCELEEEEDMGGGRKQSATTTKTPPTIPNRRGVRNALLLRAESALLAGQCLIRAGEYDRASMVYEEAMRYPPPPPPSHWGVYGYGYRLDDIRRKQYVGSSNSATMNGREKKEDQETREDEDFDALLADEMYLRSWREQSISHSALIHDGDDMRLLQLAASILPLPFSDASKIDGNNNNIMAGGIHPMARLCAARGIAFDAISNPHRAVSFLKAALTIDARCMEALDYAIKRRLLTPDEEKEWITSLNFGAGELGSMGISWLQDAYLARLRGIGGVVAAANAPSISLHQQSVKGATVVSPVPRLDMLSPSVLSICSPDFAGGAVMEDDRNQAPVGSFPQPNEFAALNTKAISTSRTIDDAFHNLAIMHNLGHSPDVLSHAAIRAYALHDLQSALAYCTAIDTIDPFCRTAGYVHVATLVGLNLKRRLFHLAHRLVDTDPKDALAWFAVGSYYYTCRRYDLAQRHFSRSTRLDPSRAECWIGFGCSFAVCDESDQALASFRAAQNKYSGSHVPLLYMGMEYLRTNHLSLAGHFLNSAQRTDPYDMLCCNELGVWSYRQGDMRDASFWFLKALRLQLRAEGSSSLNSIDEGLGMDGFILLTGKSAKARVGADSGGSTNIELNNSMDAITSGTPNHTRRSSNVEGPPVSTVLCAIKTPSGNSIAASLFSDTHAHRDTDYLSDMECVERCKDPFWEPTIFNLGQSFRKTKRFEDAIICFEKCTSLNPVCVAYLIPVLVLYHPVLICRLLHLNTIRETSPPLLR